VTLFEVQHKDGSPSAGTIGVTTEEKASASNIHPPVIEDTAQLHPHTHITQYDSDIRVPLDYVRGLRLGCLTRDFDLNYNRRPDPEGVSVFTLSVHNSISFLFFSYPFCNVAITHTHAHSITPAGAVSEWRALAMHLP
jgi:hypothetical protein